MVRMKAKWIEVFRTGTHTDSSGKTRKWTAENLDTIVKSYASRDADAPAVIGHPKSNSPAYGWVEELRRDGDLLLAKVKPTVAEFVEWVRKKLYKHVSISLRPDLSLRHVGFLGAAPPAVKGLKAPEFVEEEFTEIEIDMSEITNKEDEQMSPTEQEFEEIRKKNQNLEKSNKDMRKEFEELKKQNEKLASDFRATEEERAEAVKNIKSLRLRARQNEFEQFLNNEIAWGALNEEQKATAKKLLEHLSGAQFEDTGEETEEVTLFKEFLKGLTGKVRPEEIATRTDASGAEGKAAEFEEKVNEYIKAHEGADYKEAVVEVAREHPELYRAAQG